MTEAQLQIAVKDFADLHMLPMFHCPNEGRRSQYAGHQLKRMGLVPGVSDCFFMRGNASHKGLFLELKVPPNKLTVYQVSFLQLANTEGYLGTVAYGIDEAIKIISEFYGL